MNGLPYLDHASQNFLGLDPNVSSWLFGCECFSMATKCLKVLKSFESTVTSNLALLDLDKCPVFEDYFANNQLLRNFPAGHESLWKGSIIRVG